MTNYTDSGLHSSADPNEGLNNGLLHWVRNDGMPTSARHCEFDDRRTWQSVRILKLSSLRARNERGKLN